MEKGFTENFTKKNYLSHCRFCGNDLTNKPWHSEWDGLHHYKINLCDHCGKKTWIKVDFNGSGHDEWKPDAKE